MNVLLRTRTELETKAMPLLRHCNTGMMFPIAHYHERQKLPYLVYTLFRKSQ